MFELGIKFLASYFLGSIMGALTMGKLKGDIDIRTMGSGNAGGTNALRTQGKLFALGVIVIDVGKGIIAAFYIPQWSIPFAIQEPQISSDVLLLCCACAAVIGHVWPIWHQFKGGKGAATLVGTFLVISPILVAVMLIAFAITLIFSGFVGFATMTSIVIVSFYLLWIGFGFNEPLLIYTITMALYLIYTHRSNIQRMIAGSESKNKKVMIFSNK